MPREILPAGQGRFLRALYRLLATGTPPTLRDLCETLGYTASTNAALCHVRPLRKKGFIAPPTPGPRSVGTLWLAGTRWIETAAGPALAIDATPEGLRLACALSEAAGRERQGRAS
jgi:hypothetical protein